MDLGNNIDLLSGAFADAPEWIPGDWPVDPERAYPRPVAARVPAGDLLCQAQLGSIVSVMPIDQRLCGSPDGCNGSWHCLTGKMAFDDGQYELPLPR